MSFMAATPARGLSSPYCCWYREGPNISGRPPRLWGCISGVLAWCAVRYLFFTTTPPSKQPLLTNPQSNYPTGSSWVQILGRGDRKNLRLGTYPGSPQFLRTRSCYTQSVWTLGIALAPDTCWRGSDGWLQQIMGVPQHGPGTQEPRSKWLHHAPPVPLAPRFRGLDRHTQDRGQQESPEGVESRVRRGIRIVVPFSFPFAQPCQCSGEDPSLFSAVFQKGFPFVKFPPAVCPGREPPHASGGLTTGRSEPLVTCLGGVGPSLPRAPDQPGT